MKSPGRDSLPILEFYVVRRILSATLALMIILLGALALERILRLVEQVTSHGLPAGEAIGLIVFLVPHYLGLALPAGLFIGTIIGMRRLHERSELVVMRAFGMPMRRLLRPLLALAVLGSAVMLLLTGLAQPHSRYWYRESLNAVLSSNIFRGLRPEVFEEIGDRIVIRTDRIGPEGKKMEGFFLSRSSEDGSQVYLTAKSAVLVDSEESAPGVAGELLLSDGVLIEERRGEGEGKAITFQMEFEESPFVISTENTAEVFGPRGRDERELTLLELLEGGARGRPAEVSEAELSAEFHDRLTQAASVPVLAVLALPLALLGRGRGAKSAGLAIGVVLFVTYEKLSGVGTMLGSQGRIPPWLGSWIPWLALVAVTAGVFHHFSGDRGRGILGRMVATWPNQVAPRNVRRSRKSRRRLATKD